jgi:hypothetical protein
MNHQLSKALAQAPYADSVCQTFAPGYWEDLRQEVFLLLCTELEDRAVKAMEGGYLEYFYIRCAANLAKPGGQVARMLTNSEPLPDDFQPVAAPELADNTEQLAALSEALIGCQWYESSLFQMYAEGVSAWEIHRRTRIPIHAVRGVINGIKERAREILTKEKGGHF